MTTARHRGKPKHDPSPPFRFGFTGGVSSKPEKLLASARKVEALGYSTYGLADHFVRPFAPLIAGQAVADATSDLRITQTVLAQDFRHPAVLAKELATLDVLSQGASRSASGPAGSSTSTRMRASRSRRRPCASSGWRKPPSS